MIYPAIVESTKAIRPATEKEIDTILSKLEFCYHNTHHCEVCDPKTYWMQSPWSRKMPDTLWVYLNKQVRLGSYFLYNDHAYFIIRDRHESEFIDLLKNLGFSND